MQFSFTQRTASTCTGRVYTRSTTPQAVIHHVQRPEDAGTLPKRE